MGSAVYGADRNYLQSRRTGSRGYAKNSNSESSEKGGAFYASCRFGQLRLVARRRGADKGQTILLL